MMNARTAWIIGAVATLAGFAIGMAVGVAVHPSRPSRPESSAISSLSGRIDRLESRFDRIEDALARLTEALTAGTGDPPTRDREATGLDARSAATREAVEPPSSAKPDADLLPAIARLETKLDATIDAIRKNTWLSPPVPADSLKRARPADWQAIERFYGETGGQQEEAIARLHGESYDEVLERFGAPTTIRANEGIWNWWYGKDEGADAPRVEPRLFMLGLAGGGVVSVTWGTWSR